MSRRFGRNQKRRMQEMINSQHELIAKHVNHAISMDQEIKRQASIINHVKEVLGRHFVALEAKDVKMEILPRFIRWPRYMDTRMAFSVMSDETVPQVLDDMMLYPIETKLGELREEVAVRVVTPIGEAAMFISQDALMRMSDDRLRRTLTQQVADQLALHIVKIRNQGDKSSWH
jgi:uncharacterized protein YjiS (DUF1127 family)